MIDAVQLLRARYTTSEAAHVMADHISGLGTTSDLSGSPVLQESEATQAAQTELTAIFPGTKFTCGTIHNDNCARIQLSYPNSTTVEVNVSYDVPMIVLGDFITISADISRFLDKSVTTTQLAEVEQATFGF